MTNSAYVIIAANLLPLIMTMGGAWSLNEILPLYWCESAIIGFFTLLKILMACGAMAKMGGRRGEPAQYVSQDAIPGGAYSALAIGAKIFMAGFFTVHFGIFMFVHGIFLFGFVLQGMHLGKATVDPMNPALWLHYLWAVKWGILSLFGGHAASFFMNYLGAGEYRTARPEQCMHQPYPRVIVMHLTILLGAFVSTAMPAAGPVMVFFVAAKIFADVHAHLKERAKAAVQEPASSAATPQVPPVN